MHRRGSTGRRARFALGLAWLALAAIALADVRTPLGFSHGTFYLLALVIAAASGHRRALFPITLAASGLTLMGLVTSPAAPDAFPIGYVLGNRLVSIVMILVAGVLLHRQIGALDAVRTGRDELEQANEALARSTRLVAIAGATARIDGWSVDLLRQEVTWSDVVAEIHGTPHGHRPTLEEAIGFYHPDDQPTISAAFSACAEAGAPFDVELRLQPESHEGDVWVRATGRAVRDADGSVVTVEGAFQDVSDRKAIEAAARERDRHAHELANRLAQTLESISDAFFTLDRSWRFTYINPQGERLVQRSKEELIGVSVWEAFPDVVGSPFEANYRGAVETGRATSFEAHFAPLETWFEVRAFPNRDGLAVYFQDVTLRRADQEHLRLLGVAVERLNDIVVITEGEALGPDGRPRVVYVNEAFERITGYAPEELLEHPRLLHGPDTDQAELDRISAALEAWQPVRAELVKYGKDGRAIRLEIDVVPIANAEGRYTHVVAVERDVSERHALEEQVRRAQRLDSVGQLTGGVAHDFNNLLTVIGGNAEVLVEQLDEAPGQLRLATMISEAAARGAELTRALLAFARQQPLEPHATDVAGLVEGLQTLFERTLGEDVEIRIDTGEADVWPTFIDPHQLENSLLNLVLNARDAMPTGGRLTLELDNVVLDEVYAARNDDVAAGEYVMVAVSDTGTGIAPVALGRVFEPFYTTKAFGAGTGLGLPMVHGFIKQSRGHVSVYSEVGEGTTVRLYLPRYDGSTTSRDDAAGPADGRVATIGGRETILVVEDDPAVRSFAVDQLRALGYDVIEATGGAAALALLEDRPDVELLFTDVVMPGGMSGKQLADEAVASRPALRVLFTSGYTEDAIVHHGRLDPGVDLLTKPYRRDDLARRVREVLDTDASPP
ncbi:hypothetical protein BH23DEI1_BH23DEI1_10710 [soil metagenome]